MDQGMAAEPDDATAPAVRLTGVGKAFGGIPVLRDIDLDIAAGEVHALVGANGAGKSTLGKIIGGYYPRSSGQMQMFGNPVSSWTPDRALRAGIAMIHQELQLVPKLSVARNVFLGIENRALGVLRGEGTRRYQGLEQRFGFGLDPDTPVGQLSIADQQKVEILRALARDARVIIMDEPTSSLTANEAERLHSVIASLAAQGRTIIYVSHFLEHVLDTCGRVTVLREGRRVQTSRTADVSKPDLVQMMLGTTLNASFPQRPARRPDLPVALEVRHLACGNGVRDVSFTVRQGEITGLLGLVGSGRTETVRAIYGLDRPTGGTVLVNGQRYAESGPLHSIRQGLVMVPEDRRGQGLVMTMPVRPNMTLPYLDRFSRLNVLTRRKERRTVADFITRFGIVPAQVDGSIHTYSGGNQQKVLLAKWLVRSPGIIMLDEPTRGVDIGARRAIYDVIVQMAEAGMAVLLISSDLEEVLGLAHRAYLISAGRTTEEIDPAAHGVDDVMHRLFGTHPAAVL